MVSAFLIRVHSWFDVPVLIRAIRVISGFPDSKSGSSALPLAEIGAVHQ
jgi:hypothetical protein